MKNKGLFYVIGFVACGLITITGFQNCGQIQNYIDQVNENTNGEDDPTIIDEFEVENPDGSKLSFNINSGDSIEYIQGYSQVPHIKSVLFKMFMNKPTLTVKTLKPYVINVQAPLTINPIICKNSALPHCDHLNISTCQAIGCASDLMPVSCYSQNKVAKSEIANYQFAHSQMSFQKASFADNEPRVADCGDPNMYFYQASSQQTSKVLLAAKSCANEGALYMPQPGSLTTYYRALIASVEDRGEFCNDFAGYDLDSSRWEYLHTSGYTTFESASTVRISYQARKLNVRWKNSGDIKSYCADDLNMSQKIYDSFFPKQELNYKVLISGAQLADVAERSVTYSDPAFGNNKHIKFHLNDFSAQLYAGGAIINNIQAQAMEYAVDDYINNLNNDPTRKKECN